MPNPGHKPGELEDAWARLQQYGTQAAAARSYDPPMHPNTFKGRIVAYKAQRDMPEGQRAAIEVSGLSPATAKAGWRVIVHEDGSRDSVYWRSEQGEEVSLIDTIRAAMDDLREDEYPLYPERPAPEGEYLLKIGLADVHIGKLCVESETGFRYDRGVAVHRMVEGTRRLLHKAESHGVGRILLTLGNDILHVDNARGTTTSGTHQDTAGTIRQMYSDAVAGYIRVIELCREVAPVDLMYVPSNHDWVMGWALAREVATWFRNDNRVTASDYNMSERHRKYYRFERNIIGVTHGDGAKESDLYPLMMTEARAHISDCEHRYWYVHHTHHKQRKAQGVISHKREKDHIGMTLLNTGTKSMEGDNAQIETIRSPSPPDGWHDRNGYINRQAVECFLHEPHEGQEARFTQWF